MNDIEQYTVILDYLCQDCLKAQSSGIDFYQYMTDNKLPSKYADLVLDVISTTTDWKIFSYFVEQFVNFNSQYWPVSSYVKALYEQIYNFVYVVFNDAEIVNLQFTRSVGQGSNTGFILPNINSTHQKY